MEPLRGINTCKEIYKKNKEKYFKPKIPLTLNLSKAFLNLIFALSKYFNNWGENPYKVCYSFRCLSL